MSNGSSSPRQHTQPAGLRRTMRWGARIAKPLFWRDFRGAENLPAQGPFIFAANHLSDTDIVAFVLFLQSRGLVFRMMAKHTLFQVPILGRIITALGQIPVRRGTKAASQAVDTCCDLLGRGEVVGICPEGTTTRDPQYWPMRARTGVARIALRSAAPVFPLTIWGTQHLLPRYAILPRVFPPHRLTAICGPEVDLADLYGRADDPEAVREATRRVMAAITAQLEEIRGEKAHPKVMDLRVDSDPYLVTPRSILARADQREIVRQRPLRALWRGHAGNEVHGNEPGQGELAQS